MADNNKKIKVTLVKSLIGTPEKQRKVVRALGLNKKNQTIEHENTPVIAGMIKAVPHLLEVSEV